MFRDDITIDLLKLLNELVYRGKLDAKSFTCNFPFLFLKRFICHANEELSSSSIFLVGLLIQKLSCEVAAYEHYVEEILIFINSFVDENTLIHNERFILLLRYISLVNLDDQILSLYIRCFVKIYHATSNLNDKSILLSVGMKNLKQKRIVDKSFLDIPLLLVDHRNFMLRSLVISNMHDVIKCIFDESQLNTRQVELVENYFFYPQNFMDNIGMEFLINLFSAMSASETPYWFRIMLAKSKFFSLIKHLLVGHRFQLSIKRLFPVAIDLLRCSADDRQGIIQLFLISYILHSYHYHLDVHYEIVQNLFSVLNEVISKSGNSLQLIEELAYQFNHEDSIEFFLDSKNSEECELTKSTCCTLFCLPVSQIQL